MKVCLLSPLPPPTGGIAQWSVRMLKAFEGRREISLIHLDISPKNRKPGEGSLINRVLFGGLASIIFCLRLAGRLRQGVDVVHLTSSGSLAFFRDAVFLAICRIFRRPMVYHIRHGRVPAILRTGGWEAILLKAICRKSACIMVLECRTKEALGLACPQARITVVPNFFRLDDILEEPNKQQCKDIQEISNSVVFLGRVSHSKGIGELLQAWAVARCQDWKLVLIGSIDDEINKTLKEATLLHGVECLGELPHREAIKHLRSCSIFCLPSLSEGFPNAVLEAMTLGKPVVATNVGSIPEMIEDDAGLLIRVGDTKALTDALVLLMSKPELRRSYGERGMLKAHQHYSESVVIEKYIAEWSSASK